MSALETVLQPEPIRAWRAWRVLRFETLRDGPQLRLCAVGTRGVPKVWEPRSRTRAVCSDHKSAHEAPNAEHECGVYGLRSRSRLVKLVQEWVRGSQGGETVIAWAIGLVSLTGRVVEFELGWRAELAYPYAVTVYTDDGSIEQELRRLYAVDVDTAGAFAPPSEQPEEDLRERLADLTDELSALRAELSAQAGTVGNGVSAPSRKRRIPTNATWKDAVRELSLLVRHPDSSGVATSREVALKMARPVDDSLPVYPGSAAISVGTMLARAHAAGKAVKLRYGSEVAWTVPGRRLSGKVAGYWQPQPRRHTAFDNEVCAALEAAGGVVRATAVAERMGLTPKLSNASRVASALVRLADAERARRVEGRDGGYTARRLVFDDEQVLVALAECVARQAAAREPADWRRGTAYSGDVADLLAGQPLQCERDWLSMSPKEREAYNAGRPATRDVHAVARALSRLADEGRLVRFAMSSRPVRWAPIGTRDEDVGEEVARLSKPIAKTATVEAIEAALRSLDGDGSWIPFRELFRALEPPEGRDAKRFMGIVSAQLAKLRRGGVAEGKRVDGVNCWRLVVEQESVA